MGGSLGVPAGESGAVHYSFSGRGKAIDGLKACNSYSIRLNDQVLGTISNVQTATGTANEAVGLVNVVPIDGTLTQGHIYTVEIAGDYGFLEGCTGNLSWYGHHTGKKGLLFDP
jgi:hypothetical protein